MRSLFTLLLVLFLGGCSVLPQKPISMAPDAVGERAGRVGIVMSKVPSPNTYFPGADCLLCIAVVEGVNSDLTNHAKSLPNEDLFELKARIATLLEAKETQVVSIDEPFSLHELRRFKNGGDESVAKKDFTGYRDRYGVEKLLVIQIDGIGFKRTYAAYVPSSDPKGWFSGAGFIIDLATNRYEWYEPVEVLRSTDGEWDEPTDFPGLTNAYFQAIELGKDEFLRAFR